VRLDSEPSGVVTITPGSGDTTKVRVSAALTFTAGDWNTRQTVTVTGIDDTDAVDDTVTVSHALAGAGEYVVLTGVPGVEVVLTDRGTRFAISGSPRVEENSGDALSFQVVGSGDRPAGNVTVLCAVGATANTEDEDASANDFGSGGENYPTQSLTFTPSNYQVAQNCDFAVNDDADFEQEERFTVTLSVAPEVGVTVTSPAGRMFSSTV